MKKILLCTIAVLALTYVKSQEGTLDPSFAGKGWTTTDFYKGNFQSEYGRQVLLQTGGTYIVVFDVNGYTILARYLTKNNTLDKSYGTEGYSVPLQLQYGKAVIQADGKVIVTGMYSAAASTDFGLARFNTDGTLDNSFGLNGLQSTDFFGEYDAPYDLALQSDGKIVVAGLTFNTGGTYYDFALARYTTTGVLDNDFDGDGKKTTDFFGDMDIAYGLAIQSDGKIVVAGSAYNSTTSYDFALARYNNVDGSLDETFDGDGRQTTDFSTNGDYAFAIAIQGDNKIVVAGQAADNSNNNDDFALARYTTTGVLDSDFDGDGKQTTDFFNGGYDRANAVAIQSDGKIIAAGQANNNTTFSIDFGLARYSANGSLDVTFGIGGKQTTDFFGGQDIVISLVLQSDGKIVAAGEAYNSSSNSTDYALARYTTNGSLDNRFDRDGKFTGYYAFGAGIFTAIAVQNDGKIVAAGAAFKAGYNIDFALARFNADGTLDKTFNRTGRQTTDFSGKDDIVYAIAIQSDGKILATGRTSMPDPNDPESYLSDFALARYNTNGLLDNKFDRDGRQTTDFFGSIDEAYALAIQSDGKMVVAGRINNTNGNGFDFGLARYNTNGSLDGTFGTGGRQTTDFNGDNDYGYALAIQSDGKIVVAGTAYDNTTYYDFALARYTITGTLDGSFDGDGKQTNDFFGNYDNARAIAIQNDKIVVAGNAYNVNGSSYDFALARYIITDGSLDLNFGVDGKQTTDFFGGDDYANALAIQSDGKIVVAGSAYNDTNGSDDFALVRYTTNGTLDEAFDGDGKQTTDFSGGDNEAYAVAIRSSVLYVAGYIRTELAQGGIVAAYSLGTINSVSPVITNLTAKKQALASVLTVKALPNPSTSYFTLQLHSASTISISINVTDALGRVIETRAGVAANSNVQLGSMYRPGVYYAHIIQGNEKTTVRLVKLNQ